MDSLIIVSNLALNQSAHVEFLALCICSLHVLSSIWIGDLSNGNRANPGSDYPTRRKFREFYFGKVVWCINSS